MKDMHQKLVAACGDYAAGKIDDKALKSQSARFGIYQQRDGRMMMRTRRAGGVVTTEDLRQIAATLKFFQIPFCHLTTRLDIQAHGVPVEQVPAALERFEATGFLFRGGGSDTFRNVTMSAQAGQHPDSAFDVYPYARALSDAFYTFDTAYGLPRKYKVGFMDRPSERPFVAVQDLGFLAKLVDGRRVFEVWVGGGIGFKSRSGFKLFEALPAEDCCRLAFALARLFNEKGCRTDRGHARLRFLRTDLGDEAYGALIKEYYERETEAPVFTGPAFKPTSWPVPRFPSEVTLAEGFDVWRKLAVTPLRDGLCAVRLFVPHGNLTADQLVRLCDALESNGVTQVQLLVQENISILNVPENQLPALYNLLADELKDVDYTVRSFKGHILTCVGNSICKVGANDSPKFGDALAEVCDRQLPLNTPEKIRFAKTVLDEVRICGCPNCCTNTPLTRYGFMCRRKGEELMFLPVVGADASTQKLGTLSLEAVSCEDVVARILNYEANA